MKKIIILALFLRLVMIFFSRNINNYDLKSYIQVGELTLKKINIYPEVANLHHPYFPVFLYIEAMAYWFGNLFHYFEGQSLIWAIAFIKIIITFFDIGNLYLVYLFSKKNLKKALLYAINPVLILIFVFHGQFDSIPLFFLLLSLYILINKHSFLDIKKKEILCCLTFSLAVMIKTWPLLFIISFLKRLKNKKIILLVFVFPLISIIIYSLLFKVHIISVVKTLISYQGLWGIWGPWILLGKIRLHWQKLMTFLFLTVFFLYSFKLNKKNIIKEILGLLFFFYTFTTNFSIQYLTWFSPFMTIIKSKYYWFLTVSISIYLIFAFLGRTYLKIKTFIDTLGLIIWLFLALIFLGVYRKKNIV